MKLTFYSNFMNHHQKPICDCFFKLLGQEFTFVATEDLPKERIDMGYKDYTRICIYELDAFASKNNYFKALELSKTSDVVIIGSAPDEYIEERLKENKLTFRYSERFFKQGCWHIFDPRVLIARYKADIRYRNNNLYMLCASAYTAPDCRFIFSYPKKTYKWGYFPLVKHYDNIDNLLESKKFASILWVGRLIGCKHPEDAVFLAERLKKEGYTFSVDIIGDGEKKNQLNELIKEKNLSDCVFTHGFMPPERVREWMEKSDIYLFTSDQNEGWGAVLNESMNSGCAVVACDEIGSVPYLIKSGQNGLIYNRHKRNDLYFNVRIILENNELKRCLQKNAYKTMTELWNAETAAKRFLTLVNCIQSGIETEYFDGPCSRDISC